MSEYERLNALLCAIVDLTQHAALLRATQDAWATAVKQWASVVTLARREDTRRERETLERREVRGGMQWNGVYGYPDDDSEFESEVEF